ncbi:MAG: hypothetical protein AUJ98_04920 [Bacteroidetes bacterium CG2_30_33_31]|nr:MAG: hypothetical protein AUJ98_04920 [Bacteroidetes bacterium CG2_30_33_31]
MVDIDVNVATINADVETIALDLVALLERSNTCAQIEWGNVTLPEPILYRVEELRYTSINNFESDMYFYNTDLPIAIGMGSSSWITDASGAVNQHLQYLPFGEDYICQRNSSWNIPYTFSGKEKDAETGYSYFGARYYDSDISIWLSVDPLSSIYPTLSPYAYVANNPIIYYDPDGRIIGIVVTSMANKPGASKQGHMAIIVGNDDIGYHLFSLEDPTGHAKDYMKEYEKIVKNGNVIWPESYSSPNYVYYSHSEKSLDELLNYMSLNAPGTANAGKDRGNGYDRITSLNNVNADQEAEFLKFMQSQTGDDFIYEFATNNCASFSINSINHFFGNIINDKTAMDRPNHEFNKITKDTHNWSVIQDGKNNPMQVIDIKAENKLLLGSEGYEN